MLLCPYSSTQSLFPNSQDCSAGITDCRRRIGRYLHMEGHISHCPPVSRAAQEADICHCALTWWYISINIHFHLCNSLFPLQVSYILRALTHHTHLDTRRCTDHNTGFSHYWMLWSWPSTCSQYVCSCINSCLPYNLYFTDWRAFGRVKLYRSLLRAVSDILYILKSDEIMTRVTTGWLQSSSRGSCSTSSASSNV